MKRTATSILISHVFVNDLLKSFTFSWTWRLFTFYLLQKIDFFFFSILGAGIVLWCFRPDDAVWHHDLAADSLQSEPVCVLTRLTLTPSPSLSGWRFLYLDEQPCHWHSPTHEDTYKQIQKDTLAHTLTAIRWAAAKMEVSKRQPCFRQNEP